jgi:hypothetical protein
MKKKNNGMYLILLINKKIWAYPNYRMRQLENNPPKLIEKKRKLSLKLLRIKI